MNNPKVWNRSPKEHWLGWLRAYSGPGAYGRMTPSPKDAKTVYNRIVCCQMLIYLAEVAGIEPSRVEAARRQAEAATSLMQGSGRMRRLISWEDVEAALHIKVPPGPLERLLRSR